MVSEVASTRELNDPRNRAKVEQARSLIQRGKAGIAGRDPALRPFVNALVRLGERDITKLRDVEFKKKVEKAKERGLKITDPELKERIRRLEEKDSPQTSARSSRKLTKRDLVARIREAVQEKSKTPQTRGSRFRKFLQDTKIFGTPLLRSREEQKRIKERPLPEQAFKPEDTSAPLKLLKAGKPTAALRSAFNVLGTGIAASTQVPKALKGKNVNQTGVRTAGKIIGEAGLGTFLLAPTSQTGTQILKQSITPAKVKTIGIREYVGKKGAQQTDIVFKVRSGSNQRIGLATTSSASKKAGRVAVTKARTAGITAKKTLIGNKIAGRGREAFISSGGQVSKQSNKLTQFLGKFKVGTSSGKSATVGTSGIQAVSKKGIGVSTSAAASAKGGTSVQAGVLFPKAKATNVLFKPSPSATPRTFASLVPIPQTTRPVVKGAPSLVRASNLQAAKASIQAFATTVPRGITPTLSGTSIPLVKYRPQATITKTNLAAKEKAIPSPKQFPTQDIDLTGFTYRPLSSSTTKTRTRLDSPEPTKTTITTRKITPTTFTPPPIIPKTPRTPIFVPDFDVGLFKPKKKKKKKGKRIRESRKIAPDFTARTLKIKATDTKKLASSPALKAIGIRGIQ